MLLASEEFIFYSDKETCIEKSLSLNPLLEISYKNKIILGYSIRTILNESRAIDEDIDILKDQQYPFLWLNITWEKSKEPTEILERLQKEFGMEIF